MTKDDIVLIGNVERALKNGVVKPDLAEKIVSRFTAVTSGESERRVDGVVWILLDRSQDFVMLERCPKKAKVLGVGEWFLPGGKCLEGESAEACLEREIAEEWPSVRLVRATPLPILEGSRVPATGDLRLYLMRPYLIEIVGNVPTINDDGAQLEWSLIHGSRGLDSPVVQVRMMIAAAIGVELER